MFFDSCQHDVSQLCELDAVREVAAVGELVELEARVRRQVVGHVLHQASWNVLHCTVERHRPTPSKGHSHCIAHLHLSPRDVWVVGRPELVDEPDVLANGFPLPRPRVVPGLALQRVTWHTTAHVSRVSGVGGGPCHVVVAPCWGRT